MIKVAGCWENGWNYPLLEYDLYAFPAKEYCVNELIMTPISGIDKAVRECNSISEAVFLNPTLEPVFIDEDGEEDLSTFNHPKNALYIVGKASYSPWKALGKKHRSVKIHTPTGKGRIWGHQAMILILQHRYDCSNK